jgi:hypothetical protein
MQTITATSGTTAAAAAAATAGGGVSPGNIPVWQHLTEQHWVWSYRLFLAICTLAAFCFAYAVTNVLYYFVEYNPVTGWIPFGIVTGIAIIVWYAMYLTRPMIVIHGHKQHHYHHTGASLSMEGIPSHKVVRDYETEVQRRYGVSTFLSIPMPWASNTAINTPTNAFVGGRLRLPRAHHPSPPHPLIHTHPPPLHHHHPENQPLLYT